VFLLHPSLIFVSKAGWYSDNTGWKGLPRPNTLAYLAVTRGKSFVTLRPARERELSNIEIMKLSKFALMAEKIVGHVMSRY